MPLIPKVGAFLVDARSRRLPAVVSRRVKNYDPTIPGVREERPYVRISVFSVYSVGHV